MPKKHSAPGGPAKVKKPRKTRPTPAPRVIIKGQFKRFFTGIFLQRCRLSKMLFERFKSKKP
jgi:hypothetical protein